MTGNFLSLSITEDFSYFIGFSILVLEFLYIVFAFLITRQVKLLNDSFNTPYESFLRGIANIHFLVSLIVFVISIMLL